MEEKQESVCSEKLTCYVCKSNPIPYKVFSFKDIVVERYECQGCWMEYDIYKREGVIFLMTLPPFGTA